MVRLHNLIIGFIICCMTTASGQEILSPQDIIQKVLDADKSLQAQKLQVQAAQALVGQAGARPNPAAELELENFGAAEIGIMVTRPLELGGKRAGRVAVARAEENAVQLEYKAAALSVSTRALQYCVLLAANAGHAQLLDSALARAEHTVALLQERADAGAAAAVDVMRTQLEQEEIILEKLAVERKDTQLRSSLAALWQGTADAFGGVAGALNPYVGFPAGESLVEAMSTHPAVRLAAAAEAVAKAETELAKAEATPDLELGAGYVRNNESKGNSIVFAAGMELPLFNKNKGEVAAREYGHTAQTLKTAAVTLERDVQLTGITGEIAAIDAQLEHLMNGVLPKAVAVFTQLQQYYMAGTVSLLDILESQGTLLDVRTRTLELMTERALLFTDLTELTGLTFEILTDTE